MQILTQLAKTTTPHKVGGDQVGLKAGVTGILNAIIAALGIACVVVMIIGGINYMTSNGDTSKVEKGKKTILYGLIGLVICVLAFAIVNWAIGAINSGVNGGDDETPKDGTGLITDYTTINSIS